MNRRIAIKQFIIFSAGVALLPSCLNHDKKKVTAYNNLPLYEEDEALLAAVAEVIIPLNSNPATADIKLHLFALQMMNDCYKAEDREKFLQQMKAFDAAVQKKYNASFTQCTAAQQQVEREEVLRTTLTADFKVTLMSGIRDLTPFV